MKSITRLVLTLAVSLAFLCGATAQTSAPEPTVEQMKQATQVLRSQRDSAYQRAGDIEAQLALVSQELEKVTKQLADTKAKLDEATKPKTPEPVPADKNAKTETKAPAKTP